MIQGILVGLIFLGAVVYLYRKFFVSKPESGGCEKCVPKEKQKSHA